VTKSSNGKSVSDILKFHAKQGTVAGTLKDVIKPVTSITTGSLAIDTILGIGGLPVGRIVEVFGHPGSGKTSLALQTAAALQKQIKETDSDEHILYMDFEHALDVDYAQALGLDMKDESVIWAQPDSLEKGAALARDLVGAGLVRLMIWDSVAEAQPETVLGAETGQSQMAVRARVMSQFLQQINNLFFANDCTAVFLNHIQEKISMTGVKSDTTPGGDALKFYSSVRIKFQQLQKQSGKRFNPLTNSSEDFTISTNTQVTIVKNKVAAPQRKCTVRVRYGKGFDNFWNAIQILEGYKKITHSGAWYYFDRVEGLTHPDLPLDGKNRPSFQGEDNLLTYAETNEEWRDLVINYAAKVVIEADPKDTDLHNILEKEELIPGLGRLEDIDV
jgi:recombination protein RecA